MQAPAPTVPAVQGDYPPVPTDAADIAALPVLHVPSNAYSGISHDAIAQGQLLVDLPRNAQGQRDFQFRTYTNEADWLGWAGAPMNANRLVPNPVNRYAIPVNGLTFYQADLSLPPHEDFVGGSRRRSRAARERIFAHLAGGMSLSAAAAAATARGGRRPRSVSLAHVLMAPRPVRRMRF